MRRKPKLVEMRGQMLVDAVQDTLASFFGEETSKAILHYLSTNRMPLEEIGERYDEFRVVLNDAFGSAGRVIERHLESRIGELVG